MSLMYANIQVVFSRKSIEIDHPKIYFNNIEVETVNNRNMILVV